MKKIELDELKKIQVDILVLIDDFCQRNNIRYSLSSGTLIGAVRHNGYIPWDDDIDIMMPRADYNRFVKSFNGEFNHLSLLSPEINLNYYAPYANVFDNRTILKEAGNGHRGMQIGVKIDVFPIDMVPESLDSYARNMKKVKLLNQIMYVKRQEKVFFYCKNMKRRIKIILLKFLFLCIPYSYLQKKIQRIALNNDYKESRFVDNVVYNIYAHKTTFFCKSTFDHYVKIKFENKYFCIIRDYDDVLSRMYGNYMELPPIEQQVPNHNFEAFWCD